MTRTIRWRLAIPYALLVIVTMVGLSAYLISYVRSTYMDNLKGSLASEARLVADDVAPQLAASPNQAALETRIKGFAQRLGVRVTIIAPDGRVLAESETDPVLMENHLSRPEVQGALRGQESSAVRTSSTLGADMLYVAVPIENGSRTVGVARLSISLQTIDANLARIRRTVTLATLIAILLTIAISALLTSYTIRPLKQLTAMTRRMTQGDFGSTPLPATRDEIGDLNKAFNQMAIQLRDQIRALKTEQGKLEAVLAQMTDGVLIIDEDNCVELINPAAQRMFDVVEQNAIGRSVVEVIRNHLLVELLRKCQATGETQVTTLELSAERLFLQAIATSFQQAIPGNTLLLVQDLTRLRRLETVRQDFISNVSHELRTPLASLKALAETLQEGALEDPPAAHRFLGRMETEIDTLTQMVQELLELSRIESGRVPLRKQSLAPKALVNHAVERMSMQAERAGLRLCLECPENLPPVLADPDRMEQVLVNLLHNAVKFTPPGGEIIVSASAEPGKVVFSVRDTGVGIAAKDLPRIFERFYKADRARSGGGTGLGLSIARHLIEAHGGKIWAESVQGKGSTFYFSLPTNNHGN